MRDEKKISRREALARGLGLGAVVVYGAGCPQKELTCTDTTGLAPADVQMRTTLSYVDRTLDPNKTCDGCQLYKPGAPNACGACTILKGPVHPKGNCKSWVAKQPGAQPAQKPT